jgi:hypothetical protein
VVPSEAISLEHTYFTKVFFDCLVYRLRPDFKARSKFGIVEGSVHVVYALVQLALDPDGFRIWLFLLHFFLRRCHVKLPIQPFRLHMSDLTLTSSPFEDPIHALVQSFTCMPWFLESGPLVERRVL